MTDNKGFTLVELMVVIVIIGVLAAVAIPKFTASTNKAKASECPTMLGLLEQAEHLIYQEQEEYLVVADNDEIKAQMGVDLGNARYFDYSVTSTDLPTKFQATATLAIALGDAKVNDIVWVDQDGTKDGDTELKRLVPSYIR